IARPSGRAPAARPHPPGPAPLRRRRTHFSPPVRAPFRNLPRPIPTHLDHYTNILRYWRSIETFSLPDIRLGKPDLIETVLKPDTKLPWEDPEFEPPPENRRWKHTLYFHLVSKETVIAR